MKNTLDTITMSIRPQNGSPLAERVMQLDIEAFSRGQRHEVSIFGINYVMTMIRVNYKGKVALVSNASIPKDNRGIESIDIELVEVC